MQSGHHDLKIDAMGCRTCENVLSDLKGFLLAKKAID